jgi:transposase
LRRDPSPPGRGCHRRAGVCARAVHREPDRPSAHGLFRLRGLHAGSPAITSDRARPSRPRSAGTCPGLQNVLVSKYADHLPLYPQSQIFEREGLDLDRSTLADWVGKSTALLEPLAEAIGWHVLAGQAIFVDDTPVKMLAPGTGKTATARLWAYGRDERPWGGDARPASWYRFSPDRKGQHPKDHLSGYRGWMHADGYAGFEDIYRSSDIHEVACMAHVRRKFVDVHRAQGSDIADEAIRRIAQLYGIEKEARGSPPDRRV